MTIFGAYVWGHGVPTPTFFTYYAEVLDHTPLMFQAVMTELLARYRLFPDSGATKFVLWSDVGLHFRAYRAWAFWLGEVPRDYKVQTEFLYFPGGHGKSRLDGCEYAVSSCSSSS